MDVTQIIALITSITTLVSAIAAILAWIAKIRWSKEHTKAMNETIRAKDATIEIKDNQLQNLIINKDAIIKAKDERINGLEREIKSLIEMSPMKIREWSLSVQAQLNEYNDFLKTRLDEANSVINQRNEQIEILQLDSSQKLEEIQAIFQDREHIAATAADLQAQLTHFQQQAMDVNNGNLFNIYFASQTIQELNEKYLNLSGSINKPISSLYSDTFQVLYRTLVTCPSEIFSRITEVNSPAFLNSNGEENTNDINNNEDDGTN